MDIILKSNDYWVKIVDFLQQNWALIEPKKDRMEVSVYFIGDTSGVFDIIDFSSRDIAENALIRNGFQKYLDPTENFTEFLYPPQPPFKWRDHPNGKIYSSGRYWKD